MKIPLMLSPVNAGFPSPADDYIDSHLDLNDHIINNKASTYFVRASGLSMIDANIFEGDILVVDRSKEPLNNSIIIAVLDGELTVKRLRINQNNISLHPENKNFPIITINSEQEFEVWGVVTYIIHKA